MNEFGFVNRVDVGFRHGMLAPEKLAKYHREGVCNLRHRVDRIVYDVEICTGEHYGKDSIAKARKSLGIVVIGRPTVLALDEYVAKTNRLLDGWGR